MSEPQHIQALSGANVVKYARAQTKKDIKAGIRSIPDVLNAHEVQTMKIWDLLETQRLWGPQKTGRCLAICGISQHGLVSALTERQRRALRDYFA